MIKSITEKMEHKISEVICLNCKRRWMSLRPLVCYLTELECPGCHKTGFVIETGEELEVEEYETKVLQLKPKNHHNF